MVLVCRRRSDLEIGRNGCTVATYILAGSIGTREWCLALRKVNDSGVGKTRQRPKFVEGLQAVVYGQAFTRLVTLMVPRPVAKSQPVFAGYA